MRIFCFAVGRVPIGAFARHAGHGSLFPGKGYRANSLLEGVPGRRLLHVPPRLRCVSRVPSLSSLLLLLLSSSLSPRRGATYTFYELPAALAASVSASADVTRGERSRASPVRRRMAPPGPLLVGPAQEVSARRPQRRIRKSRVANTDSLRRDRISKVEARDRKIASPIWRSEI